MKTTFLALALLSAATTLPAAPPVQYSGTWTYDAAASKGLPPMYADNITGWTLNVTQDAKHVTSKVHIENKLMPPLDQTFEYALDGSETKTESAIVTPDGPKQVPTTLKAHVGENGALSLTITREFSMNGEDIRGVIAEEWELSADGKTLTVHRHDSMPRKTDMDVVFRAR